MRLPLGMALQGNQLRPLRASAGRIFPKEPRGAHAVPRQPPATLSRSTPIRARGKAAGIMGRACEFLAAVYDDRFCTTSRVLCYTCSKASGRRPSIHMLAEATVEADMGIGTNSILVGPKGTRSPVLPIRWRRPKLGCHARPLHRQLGGLLLTNFVVQGVLAATIF